MIYSLNSNVCIDYQFIITCIEADLPDTFGALRDKMRFGTSLNNYQHWKICKSITKPELVKYTRIFIYYHTRYNFPNFHISLHVL